MKSNGLESQKILELITPDANDGKISKIRVQASFKWRALAFFLTWGLNALIPYRPWSKRGLEVLMFLAYSGCQKGASAKYSTHELLILMNQGRSFTIPRFVQAI